MFRLGYLAYNRYLPALFDPTTQTLHFPQTAPLYIMSHAAKRLKSVALPSDAVRATEYRAQRIDLGEAFGTRKAKSRIKADERNKVDVGAMEGVRGHLMETIGESAIVSGELELEIVLILSYRTSFWPDTGSEFGNFRSEPGLLQGVHNTSK
jgi:hypothetical protein